MTRSATAWTFARMIFLVFNEIWLSGPRRREGSLGRRIQAVQHPACHFAELDGFNHKQTSEPAGSLLRRFVKRVEENSDSGK
jgi:hypothetical protein